MTDRRVALLESALLGLRRDHQRLRSRCRKLVARLRRIEAALSLRAAPALLLWRATRSATDDEHGGFVVAAESEAAARAIIDERAGGKYPTWWWDGDAKIDCIGASGPATPRGILLEDFRAG